MIHVQPTIGAITKTAMSCGVVGLFYVQPYRPIAVVGRSMEPTYSNQSFEWTSPARPSDLKRGDVVVIRTENGPIVKRIAYMPGDKIKQIKSGRSWLDLVGVCARSYKNRTRNVYRDNPVPAAMVYVLGDNLAVSLDSRSFGCIPIERIERKLVDQRPLTRPFDPS